MCASISSVTCVGRTGIIMGIYVLRPGMVITTTILMTNAVIVGVVDKLSVVRLTLVVG